MDRTRSTAALALLSLAVVACGFGPGATADESPLASFVATAAPAATDPPIEPETFDPGLPGQSESVWGPIWNDIPPSYPVPDGAVPAEADHGPVSAAYTVATDIAAPRAIAVFYHDALEEDGFGAATLDGPLEDGSFTVWSSNGYGCDSLVTVLPRGDESLVTVLFGALCRFE